MKGKPQPKVVELHQSRLSVRLVQSSNESVKAVFSESCIFQGTFIDKSPRHKTIVEKDPTWYRTVSKSKTELLKPVEDLDSDRFDFTFRIYHYTGQEKQARQILLEAAHTKLEDARKYLALLLNALPPIEPVI